MYNTGSYIEEYFLENNIRYIAINDSYDSSVGDSMLGIRLGVNDLYIRDVSKKVCSSFKIKQERGDYIGSFPCYGYKKDPNDKHKLIIDPEAAEIVKRIYNYALQGFGLNTISNRLTEEQIPIPIVYKKEPRGKLITDNNGYGIWKHGTIKNILTSEMYIGNMVQHTYKKQSYRSKKIIRIPKEEQIIVFKAILFGSNYLPDDGYEIEIYLKKDIKSIKITSDSQYNPTYTFKIGFEKDIIEFTVKEQRRQNSDCKQTVKFLTEYWK
jgi:hypothetical protein